MKLLALLCIAAARDLKAQFSFSGSFAREQRLWNCGGLLALHLIPLRRSFTALLRHHED